MRRFLRRFDWQVPLWLSVFLIPIAAIAIAIKYLLESLGLYGNAADAVGVVLALAIWLAAFAAINHIRNRR